MPTYQLFGGLLDSDVAFDGLRAVADGRCTWTFRTGPTRPAGTAGPDDVEIAARVGCERVSPDLHLTLDRLCDGSLLLRYSALGLGCFRISADGATIDWRPGDAPRLDALRWVVLGRVLATAMYAGGTLALHASAVQVGGTGLGFIAPKRHGKSTLAAALVAAGARLVSDDLLPIDLGPPVSVRPGVPVLRLHDDAERAVALAGRGYGRVPRDVGKARLDVAAADLAAGPCPLAAVYVLAPRRDEPAHGAAATRTRLSPVAALEMLVGHTSIAPLLSAAEARPLLTIAAAVARSVPVYELRVVRDLSRLPDVVAGVYAWHGPATMTSAA